MDSWSRILSLLCYDWRAKTLRDPPRVPTTTQPEACTSSPPQRQVGEEDSPPSLTELVVRAQAGDDAALDALFRRHYPVLKRLAHRRLPDRARGDQDTDDVVQITLLRAVRGLKEFEPRWENAWLAYLRQILFNYLRDEGRRSGRLPGVDELDETLASPAATPLDEVVDNETVAAYQHALDRLPPSQRDAVVMRVEHGFTYARIAERLGIASSDAARMMVKRAIARLAGMVDESRDA